MSKRIRKFLSLSFHNYEEKVVKINFSYHKTNLVVLYRVRNKYWHNAVGLHIEFKPIPLGLKINLVSDFVHGGVVDTYFWKLFPDHKRSIFYLSHTIPQCFDQVD